MRTQTIRVGLLEGKRQDPATRILQAAQEVFLREGAAKFSSRAVAKEINIRLSRAALLSDDE
jgi:AcrR family transcriptional regulator